MMIEIGEEWAVQPNRPGLVVLTDRDSSGPGDRDLQISTDIEAIVATGAGPRPVGDPVSIDLEPLVDDPPAGLVVEQVGGLEAGTRTGHTLRADADQDSPCTAEPCEFSLVTSYGVVVPIRAGAGADVWFEEPDRPTVMAVASEGGDASIRLGHAMSPDRSPSCRCPEPASDRGWSCRVFGGPALPPPLVGSSRPVARCCGFCSSIERWPSRPTLRAGCE